MHGRDTFSILPSGGGKYIYDLTYYISFQVTIKYGVVTLNFI